MAHDDSEVPCEQDNVPVSASRLHSNLILRFSPDFLAEAVRDNVLSANRRSRASQNRVRLN